MKGRLRREDVVALIVIALAGALSTVWVFLVPIFQAPDEPAHFDYAISIYNARRLIQLADGEPDWIVSPYTKYLLAAADFQRIAWHSLERVPPGYGSRQYYARVDAGAPSVYRPTPPTGRINYIVPDYPFGFYAFEALWMRTVSLFTGSIVTMFFASRLLCVFLLMIGLYFNYRTALNLELPRWTSVGLIAAIGFLPLTSFVSSYIQPDNLAYALVSASLFFATELRSAHLRPRVVLPLGLSLGLLAVTKYQFFLVTLLPIALLFGMRLARAGSTATRRIGLAAALIAPSIALLAIQHWIVDRSRPRGSAAVASSLLMPFWQARASGAEHFFHYLALNSLQAFIDFFVWGECAATFWQVVGWFDTPAVIVNDATETWLRGAIALATVTVAVTLAFYLTRNALRLLWATVRGHLRLALEIMARDPVLNAYLCFVGFMFALYIASADAFGAEGRHWYPFIFPAFLSFVWYAPRALSKRSGILTAVLTLTLLVYALCASAYALADVTARYYGPQLAPYTAADPTASQIVPGRAGVLWPIESAEYHVNAGEFPKSFAVGAPLFVAGYATPIGRLSRVAVIIDSKLMLPVLSGQYMFRAAPPFGDPASAYGEFYTNLTTTHLREGPHVVAAYAQTADAYHYRRISPTRTFFLTGLDQRFSDTFLEALAREPAVHGRLAAVGVCNGLTSMRGGVRAVASGAVLVITGRLDEASPHFSAVWLLVDSRPYPASFNRQRASFVGTIPTAAVVPGSYSVTAYAVREDGSGNERVSRDARFEVAPAHGGTMLLPNPPKACADPLRELAGT